MAKLTLSFKERKLKVFALQPGECLIGRDSQCTVVIDSLALKPQHAVVHVSDVFSCRIEACDADCTLTLNDQTLPENHTLTEGDTVNIGKYSLTFSEESTRTTTQSSISHLPAAGWLQIQSGNHLGRTIRLDKAFTRIGRPDADLGVIAHRDDGYFLSALQGKLGPTINGKPVGDNSFPLNDGDRIVIGDLQLQFFSDGQTLNESDTTIPVQESSPQRCFSRIPFNVKATLKDIAHDWETGLLDISLHGALIKVPDAFEANADQRYQLVVHLENGPDIYMDVAIAHQEAHELGLHCRDVDVDSITHLRRLVELNLGDPELLERELSALG